MYWCDDGSGGYELLDGQQRTISLCQYINGDFSLNNRYFHNLTATEQAQILDYKLMIYVCNGNDLEKLEWFRTINIAGVQLSDQELRNAVYCVTCGISEFIYMQVGTVEISCRSYFISNNLLYL